MRHRDLSATAQTINQRGVTIVPLDVKVLEDGEIYIRAKDPAYANPGPDEVQQFAKVNNNPGQGEEIEMSAQKRSSSIGNKMPGDQRMRSSYQKLTMMTCLLVSSLCFNVFAQDATENQSLSPETEMAIMKVMNLENRIQTLQTVPVKMTDNELAGHFSGTWICFTTMRLNGQLGRGHHGNQTRTRRG